MANLSISGLQNQLLDQIFKPASLTMANGTQMRLEPLYNSQKELVEYAFKDFVNYFLRLQQEAETAARLNAQSNPQQGPLYASHLHLNVSLEKFAAEDVSAFNAQGVQVSQLKTEAGFASRIEILSQQTLGDGTISYAVTVLKLAIEMENVSPVLSPMSSTQVSILPVASASGSSGSGLQDFLNRSPYAHQEGQALMEYENEDAIQLLREEERQQDWHSEQQMQALISAAVNILKYLQTFKLKAAFGMTKEESEYIENALENDPAAVVKESIIRFLKKKQIELEMLRKEVQQRLALQRNDAAEAAAFGQFERMINFYNQAQKTLEVQEFDKDTLKNLMIALDQVNLMSSSAAPGA